MSHHDWAIVVWASRGKALHAFSYASRQVLLPAGTAELMITAQTIAVGLALDGRVANVAEIALYHFKRNEPLLRLKPRLLLYILHSVEPLLV